MDFNDLLSNAEKKDFSESLKQLLEDTEKIQDEEHPLEEVTKFNASDILEALCLNNLKIILSIIIKNLKLFSLNSSR